MRSVAASMKASQLVLGFGLWAAVPGRPETVNNPLGTFQFNHLAQDLLFGYSRVEVAPRQFAFIASPEKVAALDKESAELEAQANRLAEEIVELGGETPTRIS